MKGIDISHRRWVQWRNERLYNILLQAKDEIKSVSVSDQDRISGSIYRTFLESRYIYEPVSERKQSFSHG